MNTPDGQEEEVLVAVLPQYQCTNYGLNVLYPSRRQLPLAVSAFIDLMVKKLSELEDQPPAGR